MIPVVNYINSYRRDLAGFFANGAASTQGSSSGLHYLRVVSPINPELLMPYAARPETNRTNPYLSPGGYAKLIEGSAGFRLISVHEQPIAGALAVAVGEHNFGGRNRVNNCESRAGLLHHR